MRTDSLYLALSEHDLFDCIQTAMKKEWNSLQSGDSMDELSANSTTNFFPYTCCTRHKKHHRPEPGLFREEFLYTEFICLCSETYFCYDSQSNKFKFSSKSLNKRTLEGSGDGLMSKYRKVLEKVVIVMSTSRGFRRKQQAVATYELRKKRLS